MGSRPPFIQTSVRGGACAFGLGVGGRGVQVPSRELVLAHMRGSVGQRSVRSEMGSLSASRLDCEIPGVDDVRLTPQKPSLSKDTA